jgi:two-component system, OmpR family, phosphate regulon sensor histidine kinase PhoR
MARRIRGQLLDGLLETTSQPTIGLDRSGAVRFSSASFVSLYPGVKDGKVLWHSLDSDDLIRWVSDCLDSTDPAPREQIMTHFPECLWMARLEPIVGEAGRCSGWILTLQDIAPVEPMSQKFDTLLAEVRAGLSRPLAGIKSRLEVLLEGAYKDPDLTVELLHQLNEDSTQLARLLFSLESPADQEQTPDLPEDTATSLKTLAGNVQQTFEPLARSKNLALKLLPGHSAPELKSVSEEEFNLCLTNLVDNAIKYTALNGYGEVVISWETDMDGVTVKVDDTGPGIPAAAREVVFEQFYRLSDGPTAQLGGTGLGLWRVKEIAEKRSGKVWAEDSPKGGAGLRLRFPL